MAKPKKRVRVKVVTDGLSAKTAKKVETFLTNAIGDDLGKASSGKVPKSGFPKQVFLIASGFGKHVIAPLPAKGTGK